MSALAAQAQSAGPARPSASQTDLRPTIRAWAHGFGFEIVGFAAPDLPRPLQAAYRHYIEQGRQGDMAWLAREPERRQSPRGLWPEVQSVIVLGVNYGPDADPLATLSQRDRATISVYARNRDYHDLIKGRLKQLADRLHRELAARVKVFVDTAPVLEKPLAQQAGIGWQGKHSNLVSRQFGSWLFLGEIFCDLPLEPDQP
ncbi:MAG: tRNA epoxyqueuosine(34) reductase QueG, partial [Myxococcota bacterium]